MQRDASVPLRSDWFSSPLSLSAARGVRRARQTEGRVSVGGSVTLNATPDGDVGTAITFGRWSA